MTAFPELVCPRCRALDADAPSGLRVAPLLAERSARPAVAGHLDDEHALACANPHCGARYPVIDGIAVIPPCPPTDALDLLAVPLPALTALLDGAGYEDSSRAAPLARLARHARCGFDDWLHTDAALPRAALAPHAVSLMRWLAEQGEPQLCAGERPRGVLGAAMGREAWCDDRPTVLIDAWLPALRAARRLAREGRLELPVPVEPGRWTSATLEARHRPGPLALVCCDAGDPPLLAGALSSVILSNLVDSVADPFVVLGQAAALVADGGSLTVSSPMTWRASITPPERWLSRAVVGGSSEAGLLAVLAHHAPQLVPQARTVLAWSVPVGAAEQVVYQSVARRFAAG